MNTESFGFPVITESGALVELPKYNRLPLQVLFPISFAVVRKDWLSIFQILEHNVEQWAELKLYCDYPELSKILVSWVKDSAEEPVR